MVSAVDAREGTVRESDDLVARQDQGQHAIEAGEAGAGNAVGVNVLGAPQVAQHLLGFEHAAHDVFLHVVGDARLGEAFQHARVRVPWARTGGQRLWDFEGWIDFH